MFLRSRLLAATAAGITFAALTTTPALATPAKGSAATAFVTRSGDDLRLQGHDFRYGGTNNYYLMYSSHLMTDAVLDKAAANGFNVVRTWAWMDQGLADGTQSVWGADKGVNFQYFDPATGHPAYNDGADGLQRLDYVVSKAKADNLRLVLPLTNNWTDFGGMNQYVKWRELQLGSSAGLTHSSFYSDPVIRGWYKDWINHLLNHTNIYTGLKYKDDPTIMAWELANEPRCEGTGGSYPTDPACNVATLTSWVSDSSRYIKSIDSHHLVATGSEGELCTDPTSSDFTINCSKGVDEAAFAALPSIDYLSMHLYPDYWMSGTPTTADRQAYGTAYIKTRLAAGRHIRKPVVLGEFGLQDQSLRNPVYQSWLTTFALGGGTGALYWILSDKQDDGTLYPDYDGFTVYCPGPVCTNIANFATFMRTGRFLFPPVADNDTAKTPFETTVTLPATANDIAYDFARVRPATVDLDPTTAGRQSTVTVAAGTFTAAPDGSVTYVPAAGFSGKAVAGYTVLDTFGRLSNVATLTVNVKPSPTAPVTLFDFEGGKQGWDVADSGSTGTVTASPINVSQGTGSVHIQSAGGFWFGASFDTPVDLTGKTSIRYDVTATTGTSTTVALKLGPSFTWCQLPDATFITTPHTGEADMSAGGAVTADLTALSDSCKANINQVDALYISVNGGSDTYVDYVRAY